MLEPARLVSRPASRSSEQPRTGTRSGPNLIAVGGESTTILDPRTAGIVVRARLPAVLPRLCRSGRSGHDRCARLPRPGVRSHRGLRSVLLGMGMGLGVDTCAVPTFEGIWPTRAFRRERLRTARRKSLTHLTCAGSRPPCRLSTPSRNTVPPDHPCWIPSLSPSRSACWDPPWRVRPWCPVSTRCLRSAAERRNGC